MSDIERSVAFYRDALGLDIKHRQVSDNEYTHNMLGYNNARLNIAQMQMGERNPRSGHVVELIEFESVGDARTTTSGIAPAGSVHVAFEINSIAAVTDAVLAKGGHFVSEVQDITAGINKGGRVVWLRDPDGITIELVEPPPSEDTLVEDDDGN